MIEIIKYEEKYNALKLNKVWHKSDNSTLDYCINCCSFMFIYVREEILKKQNTQKIIYTFHILLKNSDSDHFRNMSILQILSVSTALSIVDHWRCKCRIPFYFSLSKYNYIFWSMMSFNIYVP